MKEYDFAFYSDIGGRPNNEDACLVKRLDCGYLFVVADGLGGHEDGELASNAAVNSLKNYFLKTDSPVILEAAKCANDAVIKKQLQSSSKMKTTIALAYVVKGKITIAHVGDTRVYALKNNKIIFQTKDHSASQLAVSVGEIEQKDIRNHPDRNILTRALGAESEIKIDIKELNVEDCDSILICSDGFWEYIFENEIEKCRLEGDTAERWLFKMRRIHLERLPEKCDNNTAIAVIL